MYRVTPLELETLRSIEQTGCMKSVFTTYEWVSFLKENQKIVPVVLQLEDGEGNIKAYFVGGIIRKNGFKILGSPFEGWLTCEMGFMKVEDYDINIALTSVAKFAFKSLKCHYVQINDYSITAESLNKKIKRFYTKLLHIDTSKPLDEVLDGFTKNGRRDVRASLRKDMIIQKTIFDRSFIDTYYDQLIEVFAKQNLKPFYSKNKLYDLADAFSNSTDKILALVAKTADGNDAGTVFSLGFGDWAYYVGAASYREYQKMLPNEALFWAFVEYWHNKGIGNLDLVGYREYKLKYNPKIIEVPVVYFERFFGIYWAKNLAKKIVVLCRKLRGK